MRLEVRRIGNWFGVIVPKEARQQWGIGQGDCLQLSERGVRPILGSGSSHQALDELKRLLSLAVIRRSSAQQIRAQSLANLCRWKHQGMWVSAYDEWKEMLQRGNDGELFAAMLGRDDRSNRLRQSMPYVGLLSQAEVKKIYEEAAG